MCVTAERSASKANIMALRIASEYQRLLLRKLDTQNLDLRLLTIGRAISGNQAPCLRERHDEEHVSLGRTGYRPFSARDDF